MTRRRTAAQRAPQTKDQAVTLLGRYALLDAEIAAINAEREAAVAIANTAADQRIVPLEAEMKDLHKQIAAYWAVSHEEHTGGKVRSIELGGCLIGFRLTPPKLVHGYAKDAEAAVGLHATSYGPQLTKVSYSLDKPAILRRIDEEDAAKALRLAAGTPAAAAEDGGTEVNEDLRALGFAPKQTDEFFVAPLAAARPTSVTTPAD